MSETKRRHQRKPILEGAPKIHNRVALTARQLKFVNLFTSGVDSRVAAVQAGFSDVKSTPARLLRVPAIREAIEKRQAQTSSSSIADRVERLEILTKIVRGQDPDAKVPDKISAATLISRMNGELIKRTEISGPAGGPIELGSLPLSELISLLRETRKR